MIKTKASNCDLQAEQVLFSEQQVRFILKRPGTEDEGLIRTDDDGAGGELSFGTETETLQSGALEKDKEKDPSFPPARYCKLRPRPGPSPKHPSK